MRPVPSTATLSHAEADKARITEQSRAKTTFRLFLVVFFAVTVMQRFAVPSSSSELGIGFVVCVFVVAIGLLTGHFAISLPRLALYGAAMSAMLATLFAKTELFSFFSLFMLLILYSPFVVTVTLSNDQRVAILRAFQSLMLLCSACGLGQFSIQLAFGPSSMFPFDNILPASMFIPGFNLRIPVADGVNLLKSTGLWFLEPSHFAQFLASAIIIELFYFRRPYVLAVFAVSYLVSFSGSGILLLVAAIGFSLVQQRKVLPFALLAMGAVAVLLLRDIPPFSVFLGRLSEFTSTQSSGSARFFAPYWFVHDIVAVRPSTLLFGYGPGRMVTLGNVPDYAVLDSGWLKLLAEYGLVGAVPFLTFYCYCLFRNSPDPLLSFACLFQFLFLGGYLNAFYLQFLHMAFVIWPRVRRPSPEANVHRLVNPARGQTVLAPAWTPYGRPLP